MMGMKSLVSILFSAALLVYIAVPVTVGFPPPCTENATGPVREDLFPMVQVGDCQPDRCLGGPLPRPADTLPAPATDPPVVEEVRVLAISSCYCDINFLNE
jgi:hypothetical protein